MKRINSQRRIRQDQADFYTNLLILAIIITTLIFLTL
jgi:hypothetical protein